MSTRPPTAGASRPRAARRPSLVLGLGGLCVISAIVVAIVIPNTINVRKHGNEAAALGSGAAVTVSLPERPVLVAERTQ